MACRPFGAVPLPKPTPFWLGSYEIDLSKFEDFHWIKLIWKCLLQNIGHLSRHQCAKWPYLLRCLDCSTELSCIYHPLRHTLFIRVKGLRFRMSFDMYEIFTNGEYMHNVHKYMFSVRSNGMMSWSLVHERCGLDFIKCNFVLLILIFTSYDNAARWIPQALTDDKSALVRVMACCRQATSHCLSQCCPIFVSSNGVTRPKCDQLFSNTNMNIMV